MVCLHRKELTRNTTASSSSSSSSSSFSLSYFLFLPFFLSFFFFLLFFFWSELHVGRRIDGEEEKKERERGQPTQNHTPPSLLNP